MKILILGASGMLGHTALKLLSRDPELDVYATVRTEYARSRLDTSLHGKLITGIDVLNQDLVLGLLNQVRPNVVLNCVGLIKQLGNANDPLAAIPLNSLFPHRLAQACQLIGARLIHVSTDCVFSGKRGNYAETDLPDASDLYGRTKLLGEVNYEHCITLRTSIIGREIDGKNGLVEWFLGQSEAVRGYTRALFSGVTTDELSKIIIQHVLPNTTLNGTWHVSSSAITKHELLFLLRDAYGRDIRIDSDDTVKIDRSLNSSKFRTTTGYIVPTWAEMVLAMRNLEENNCGA